MSTPPSPSGADSTGTDEPQAVEEQEEVAADTQPTASAGTGEAAAAPEPDPASDPLAEAEARAQEYLDLAQRKQAEFENFRKRMSAQAAQAESRGIAKLAKELLPALDHLLLAIEHADEAHKKPLEGLLGDFSSALGRFGIEWFSPLGEVFDPNQHEAMAQSPVEGAESGTVAQVYQAGFRHGETVLRPARVVVAA